MTKEKHKINWSSPRKIPVIHEITEDRLKKAKNQLANLKRAQNNAHPLEEATTHRVIKTYREQQQIIPRTLKQCKQWRQQETLNRRQLAWVREIEDTIELLDDTITEILKLAHEIEKNTRDKPLQKYNAALGLNFFLGNVNLSE